MPLRLPFAVALAAVSPALQAAPQEPAPKPAPSPAQAPKKLGVGDPAPALSIEKWVKGGPIASFEKGKVYLVDLWATWNKKCVANFPLLTELQKKHEGKLTIIGLTAEDPSNSLEKVEAMVKEKGDAIGYAVAWDKGKPGETWNAYLKAAGRDGIPCCFLVDGEGRLTFLGDPLQLGPVLEPVLAGTHDIQALAARQLKVDRAPQTFRSYQSAAQGQRWPEVISFANELLEVDPVAYGGVAQMRFLAQVKQGAIDKAYEWAKGFVDGPGWNSPEGLNAVSWAIVDPDNPIPKQDLDLAMKAAERADVLTKHVDGPILDTLARCWFLKGDPAKALELEKKAIEKLTPEQKRQFIGIMQKALKQYEEAVAAQQKQ